MKSVAEQMSIYEAYHRNPWNKATHFVGIPVIVFSILIPLSWLAVPVGHLPLTAAMAVTAVVLGYYFALDTALAAGMTAFLLPALYLAHAVAQWPMLAGGAMFAGFFVGGWIVQFIGHVVFEKRKPAFTDNLFQLIIGPLFICAELYYLFGCKHALREEVKRLDAARPTP